MIKKFSTQKFLDTFHFPVEHLEKGTVIHDSELGKFVYEGKDRDGTHLLWKEVICPPDDPNCALNNPPPLVISGSAGAVGPTGPAGPAGEKGPSGAQGERGPQGQQGPQGNRGADGANGVQGATGANGFQGATGVDGVQGATGADGVQGATGADGVQGATGVAGVAVIGATGAKGVDGATGPAGSPGGATGATGLDGATGAIGLDGATGIIGATGLGATGFDGATGVQGMQGATGIMGATGIQGINGATGLLGATGFDGATGPQGPPGNPGGATGLTGATGVSGSSISDFMIMGATGTLSGTSRTPPNLFIIYNQWGTAIPLTCNWTMRDGIYFKNSVSTGIYKFSFQGIIFNTAAYPQEPADCKFWLTNDTSTLPPPAYKYDGVIDQFFFTSAPACFSALNFYYTTGVAFEFYVDYNTLNVEYALIASFTSGGFWYNPISITNMTLSIQKMG